MFGEELTNRKAVDTSPSDSTLGLNLFKIADQEHAKEDAGWNPGATADLAVVGSAELLDPSIEACFFKKLIELRLECVSLGTEQIYNGDEQILLLYGLASTKDHRALLHGDCVDRHQVPRNGTSSTGC
jgi:hypothetical protein